MFSMIIYPICSLFDKFILLTTYFVKSFVSDLYFLTVSSWGPSGTMKFRNFKNIDTLPQCILGSFGINKEQIKVFKELKEHFWRKSVLYQTIKTKERPQHSCTCDQYWGYTFHQYTMLDERTLLRSYRQCPQISHCLKGSLQHFFYFHAWQMQT